MVSRLESVLLGVVLAVSLARPIGGQSASIQGVWRPVARTIPASSSPGDRSDPFAHVPVGTQSSLQPGILIFTSQHYSRVTDTALHPRPTTPDASPGGPTAEELQARWGPFQANAGTYEVSGDLLTLRVLVSKDPTGQREGNFARLSIRIDGNRLWLTPVANRSGPIAAGVTSEYVRLE